MESFSWKWNFCHPLLTLVSFQTCMTFFLLKNTGGDVSLKHGGGFCSNVEQYFHFWVNYSQQYLTLNKYVEIGVEIPFYLKWFIYILGTKCCCLDDLLLFVQYSLWVWYFCCRGIQARQVREHTRYASRSILQQHCMLVHSRGLHGSTWNPRPGWVRV